MTFRKKFGTITAERRKSMNKNNLTEEQLCKFCYNLCVKCNWDNNKIWREAKRNNMITNDIKYNAKVYMSKLNTVLEVWPHQS